MKRAQPVTDVAIIGGGLAGSMLARQLRRQCPNLQVVVYEREHETSYKVGESTVEIASHYLVHRLGLSTYLYEEQLPKNGLRFFFDNSDKSLPIEDMSELGSDAFPPIPSFQIDRARFERDLRAMNLEDGVEYRLGARVESCDLASGTKERRHALKVTLEGGAAEIHHARWVVDASGRSSLLARQQKLRVARPDHAIAASWGRYRQVVDIDALDHPEWRRRVRHTSRMLSTNHFCYDGYWIWLIPLSKGITSVGVVGEPGHFNPSMRKPDGLLEFLRGHRAVGSLVERVDVLDTHMFGQLAYATKRFFSPDGWFVVGDAAAFVDPFYSPGSDFIAIENDFVSDLIGREAAGNDGTDLAERYDMYEKFMHLRFEATLLLHRGIYGCLGSFEILCLKWFYDLSFYYGLWVWSYLLDEHFERRWLQSQLRREAATLKASENLNAMFATLMNSMRESGRYHERNTGRFYRGLTEIDWIDAIGKPRSRRELTELSGQIFNDTRSRAKALLDGAYASDGLLDHARYPAIPIADFVGDRPILE